MTVISRDLTRSKEYLERAKKVIPAATQTFSKGPTQYVQGVAPIYLQSGKGSHVFDVDGNEYIDYAMALGPIILGYAYPNTIKAITKQLEEGITFTLMHPLEVELAELLVGIIPCAKMVRYGKNGSDATSAAIRASRAYTGREKIACCGYHGWQDWYIVSTTRDKGVPKFNKDLIYTFEYNKIETLEKIFNDNKNQIAAVIMEPFSVIEPTDGFLEKVKELTHENGAVLIFDEIITGFRISMGGAQEYFKVVPDLACFGKAVANGMPLSIVAGKSEIMKEFEEVFFSFTFGGETLSLAVAITTIKEMKEKKVIDYIWRLGEKLRDGYNTLVKKYGMEKYTECIGLGPRTSIVFRNAKGEESLEMKSLFQQECIKRGILFMGAQNICYSHTDKDIEKTLLAYEDAMQILKEGIEEERIEELLEGKKVEPVFRKI